MSSGPASRRAERRARLFDLWGSHFAAFAADNLVFEVLDDAGQGHYFPPSAELYVCPLCLRVLTRHALDPRAGSVALTLEDVPPRRVTHGITRTYVLTCKECNNSAGARAESDLEAVLAFRDLRPGHTDGYRECTLRAGDAAVQAHLTIAPGNHFHFEVVGDASANGREGFFSTLKESAPRLTVTLRHGRRSASAAALVKAAYLLAFASFGYSYILSTPSLRFVRDRIATRDADPLLDPGVVYFTELPSGLVSPSISIVQSPPAVQSLLVVFTLRRRGGEARHFGVFLPGPEGDAPSLYTALAQRPAGDAIQAAVLLAPPPGAQVPVRTPAARHAVSHEWKRIFGDTAMS